MSFVRKNFNFDGISFNCFAVVTSDNNVYYKLKELAEFLEYVEPKRAYEIVDHQFRICWVDLAKQEGLPSSPSGYKNWQPHTIFVSESGIYDLMLQSKKPRAKMFKYHILKVVLPEIRKTHEALVEKNKQLEETRGMLAEHEKMALETRELLSESNKSLVEERRQKRKLQNVVKIMRPKVAVIPDSELVRHTLGVFKHHSKNIYKCVRTQNRNFYQAFRRIPGEFQFVRKFHNVPNAINIINRLKEYLPNAIFKRNEIISDANVPYLIAQCIETEINRPIVYRNQPCN